jgi:hypothetical protein
MSDSSLLLPEPVMKIKKKKRIYNRHRRLQKEEFQLLREVWRWKLLNYPVIQNTIFKAISKHNSYSKIRRLLKEGYIEECFGTKLDVTCVKLTKKGFEQIKYDVGYITQDRFKPQSVTHDYWAMAFQRGEFAINPNKNVSFITEQELQARDHGTFLVKVPESKEHIPDGLTVFGDGEKSQMVAVEVELNLKPNLRYVKAAYYFDSPYTNIDTVFWLCDRSWLMEKIFYDMQKLRLGRMDIHHFVLLEDFKELGWNAKARSGRDINKTIREVYAQRSTQLPSETPENSLLGKMQELYFSNKKSPWKPKP